jgi:hypothetical protein
MERSDESEFGIRRETGEIYMLNKKERLLTIEILKLTLATPAGRGFLVERFGKEGLKTAAGLLEEMGVQISQAQRERQKPAS